ncbi:DUF3040 domain-containing protein [Corynebacterium breve]|uniref:DUF3040 domain-containing protein n=1 Tax=Corynebacterium breve TaxID=3049799 RepID=A0ABY8VDG1_9CORY|nr:DUF3040 domain-containing protein [Corynebacterium breve]WIM66981.1 DUF3040 domain-containing protein [Corynebacterium breve]
MALSEQEQRALREIEQSLLADDPKFGASVSGREPLGGGIPSGRATLRGSALIVLGLVLLIAGVALSQMSFWFIALSVVGFIVMFAGGVWILKAPQGVAPQRAHPATGGQGGRSGVGLRMEENFRRRFEGQ